MVPLRRLKISRSLFIIMAENRGPELLAVNIVFCSLTGIIVLLRCYTRVFIVKAFGTDDWIMLLAMVYIPLLEVIGQDMV